MSRPVVILLVCLVVIVGGLVLLAGRATETAPVQVEKVVPVANLS